MSRAFVKEAEDEGGELPERAVSAHRNLVTPGGLAAIEAELHRLDAALTAARAQQDKAAITRCQRDLRYWTRRRATAELVPLAGRQDRVRFGARVTLEFADGRRRVVRIVGEDEADPTAGSVSYVAPVALQMLGAGVGATILIGAEQSEIIAID